jgi:mono/diheme cytochrome c family protein
MRKVIGALLCAAALQGCSPGAALGIYLPVGNADRGREAFIGLECHACHRVEGVDLPAYSGASPAIALGGHTPRIESHADIVTSIINPSHRLARSYRTRASSSERESPMAARYLNDVMTVQQLVDLVAFLHAEYENVPAPLPPYWLTYPSPEDPLGFPASR